MWLPPVSGWNTANHRCGPGYFGSVPPEGVVFAIVGNGSDDVGGSLSQTITGLTIGKSYVVSFELGGEDFRVLDVVQQVVASMLSGSATWQTYSAC